LSRSKNELHEINFSFISSRLQICKLPDFGFYYALIQSEVISHLLRKTGIATTRTLARKNSPGGIRKNSSRGNTVTFNQGLQTASAHSQYLGRWNMMTNGKPIPSVKTLDISTEEEKRDSILLHHLSIELCKSKFGVSPFEIPDTFSLTYKRVRSELRVAFYNSLDPSGIVQRNHQINLAEIAESITGKGNEGLIIHSDKLNCPVLDTTLSLTSLHTIEELLVEDEVTVGDIHKSFDVSKGLVAANILGYTRSAAHLYSQQAAYNIDAIASTKTDELTSLCIRLLSETGIAFDYQGYLWETEDSFDERATHLAKILHNENSKWIDTVREICGSERKILRSSACFEKMGFYSIYLHVLLSMHVHGFIKSKWDVRCLGYFFGSIQNGTSVLVAVWDELMANKHCYLAFIPALHEKKRETCLLVLLNSCERRIRLRKAMTCSAFSSGGEAKHCLNESDYSDVRKNTGSNPMPRFTHGPN